MTTPANIERVQSLQVPEDADDEVRELTDALLRYSNAWRISSSASGSSRATPATSCAARSR